MEAPDLISMVVTIYELYKLRERLQNMVDENLRLIRFAKSLRNAETTAPPPYHLMRMIGHRFLASRIRERQTRVPTLSRLKKAHKKSITNICHACQAGPKR